MKRFVAVLAGLLALPAFADSVPARYEESGRSTSFSRDVDSSLAMTAQRATNRTTVNRAGVSRAVASDRGTITRRDSGAAAGRVVASSRSAEVAPVVGERRTVSRAANAASVISRNATLGARQSNVSATSRTVNVDMPNASRAATSANVASRVRARAATVSSSLSSVNNDDSVAAVSSNSASVTGAMENIAAMTSFCKAQYAECMDNFCNVLDDNQGRCSCSKNIKNYEKTENALKAANEALQDVAQQIQYIGLSKDEINTLFSQTEAELVMSNSTDNSQLKNDLDKIKGLIVQVKSGVASSSYESGTNVSMDLSGLLDFSIDSTGFDLSSMFATTKNANTNSISNQRGEQLYKTAAARCQAAVLTDCQAQGVDVAIVTNSYDMEIDKQCVAYERSLTNANDEMSRTVRNAKAVLQRARLMVAQQKNSYDLRGCVNALDSCMQDDFVCGNEYENCLDPSGKYIVNGEIVVGSAPGQAVKESLTAPQYSTDGLYSTWNYTDNGDKNAWAVDGSLASYVSKTLSDKAPTTVGSTMSEYLLYKMGYIDANNKASGMCSSVLSKCQNYTFEGGKYKPKNRVVEEFLMRTLVNIKKSQDAILADYAESCITDISSCLGENNYDETNPTSTKSKIAINACRSQIVTCMSVTGNRTADPSPSIMAEWVKSVMTDFVPESVMTDIVPECSETTTGDCIIKNHMNAHGDISCSVSGSQDNGFTGFQATSGYNICEPSENSCKAIGGVWQDSACYCTGGKTWKSDTEHTVGGATYTGYVCIAP